MKDWKTLKEEIASKISPEDTERYKKEIEEEIAKLKERQKRFSKTLFDTDTAS